MNTTWNRTVESPAEYFCRIEGE